jgi:sec-independent protein translocase protein TatA
MALDPLEWGVIAVIGIGVFIWGPEKLPEIARQIGSARRQLDSATKELQGLTKELEKGLDTGNLDILGIGNAEKPSGAPTAAEIAAATVGSPTYAGPTGLVTPSAQATAGATVPAAVAVSTGTGTRTEPQSADEMLIEMAKALGIPTLGRTRDEIQQEILKRATGGSSTAPPVPSPADGSVTPSSPDASTPTAPVGPEPDSAVVQQLSPKGEDNSSSSTGTPAD